ncbi:MAG: CoA-binding protein [Bacteroidota bacterium]|nr:CoA-binding protein [Bacteroidota bacterium]
MSNKKTLVLGASSNHERYSYLAINKLREKGHDVIAIGKRTGKVKDVEINSGEIAVENLDTVTLYLNANNQKPYYNYIFSLKPKRLIFNPGAENKELSALANKNGIHVQEACTLVLLATGQY